MKPGMMTEGPTVLCVFPGSRAIRYSRGQPGDRDPRTEGARSDVPLGSCRGGESGPLRLHQAKNHARVRTYGGGLCWYSRGGHSGTGGGARVGTRGVGACVGTRGVGGSCRLVVLCR